MPNEPDHYYFDSKEVAKGFKQGVETIADKLIDYHLSARATEPKLRKDGLVAGKYEVKVYFQEEP